MPPGLNMKETKYLRFLLNEVGHSVHNLNTIAVSLSNLSSSSKVDPALTIKWEPKDIKASSINARRFAVRAAIVFGAENLFEYLNQISNDSLWKSLNNGIDFNQEPSSHVSKANRFSEFCKGIPSLEKEWVILVELLCHWRNRIVHASTSKAALSAKDRQYLQSKAHYISESHHHFNVKKTLSDYEADKVTLKEATTMITFLIKCCRKIDEHYNSSVESIDVAVLQRVLERDEIFNKLLKQPSSDKKTRQINKFIEINLGMLAEPKCLKLASRYT